jgi:hypothetical protein
MLQAFEPYIEALAERLAERLERRRSRMVNQHDSELGPRRHRDAVKRRMANDEGGAGHSGRNYWLTREAIREELASKPGRGKGGAAACPAGDDKGPPSKGPKSRERDLGEFERELLSGLRAVKT